MSSSHWQLISILAGRVFHIIPGWRKGPDLEIWHSFTFLLVRASPVLFFSPQQHEQDGISGGQKETEQKSFEQLNLWVSIPQRSVCLPCGCSVFVHPSSLITIMSPQRSMRAGFLCVLVRSQSVCLSEDASKSLIEGKGKKRLFNVQGQSNSHHSLCGSTITMLS